MGLPSDDLVHVDDSLVRDVVDVEMPQVRRADVREAGQPPADVLDDVGAVGERLPGLCQAGAAQHGGDLAGVLDVASFDELALRRVDEGDFLGLCYLPVRHGAVFWVQQCSGQPTVDMDEFSWGSGEGRFGGRAESVGGGM